MKPLRNPKKNDCNPENFMTQGKPSMLLTMVLQASSPSIGKEQYRWIWSCFYYCQIRSVSVERSMHLEARKRIYLHCANSGSRGWHFESRLVSELLIS